MNLIKITLLFLFIAGCQTIPKEQLEGKWKLNVYEINIDRTVYCIDLNNLDSSYQDYYQKALLQQSSINLMTKKIFMQNAAFISQCYLNLYSDGKCEYNIVDEGDVLRDKTFTYSIDRNYLHISDGSKYKILQSERQVLKLLSSSKNLTLTFCKK